MVEDIDISYEDREQFRRIFKDNRDTFDKQRNEFFKHVDNYICQKCGKKEYYLHGIGLDCFFYNQLRSEFMSSGWFSKAFDFKIKDYKFKDDDFVICCSKDCVVLCKDCITKLKEWLEIPVHDSIDSI